MIDDHDFWKDCFRKSPVIAIVMLLFTIAGAAVGVVFTAAIWQAIAPGGRVYPSYIFVVIPFALGFVGLIIGLVAGVILDSIVGIFRGKEKPQKKKKRAAPKDGPEFGEWNGSRGRFDR